jgi:hypothetical protein
MKTRYRFLMLGKIERRRRRRRGRYIYAGPTVPEAR